MFLDPTQNKPMILFQRDGPICKWSRNKTLKTPKTQLVDNKKCMKNTRDFFLISLGGVCVSPQLLSAFRFLGFLTFVYIVYSSLLRNGIKTKCQSRVKRFQLTRCFDKVFTLLTFCIFTVYSFYFKSCQPMQQPISCCLYVNAVCM